MIEGWIEAEWPAPGNVRALTTLRTGGASSGPYHSLNLGDHVGDDPHPVAQNRQLLSGLLPGADNLCWLQQVHGTEVIEAGELPGPPRADASWSRTRGQACVVLTADCLPVLFCSRSGDVVAAAHAGWRGLLAGVLEQTIAAMGVEDGDLLAWLGPAIGPGAFEVGAEVRSAFLGAAPSGQREQVEACFAPSPHTPGRFLADLYALARQRLAPLGPGAVFGGGYCTFTDAQRFFSYRRDGGTGRMASLIFLTQART